MSMGKWGGIRSPPGLNRQDSTKHDRTALQGQTDRTGHDDRKALQGQTDKTGHPTGTRSPPGLARRLRLLLGMTRSQGPSQGPSATASTSATRGQAARMASMATTRGAACPRRVSMDKTRQGRLKCSCGHNKTDTWHSWPWHVDLIHGARDSGGQRAWINADPVGLSQRQSGGLESVAIRRALRQRRAGGHWVRGDPVAWSPANGAPGGAATRELGKDAGGLGRATAGDGYLPRLAGMRARGQWTRGTRGNPAELPRRLAMGYGGNEERRLPCRGTDIHKHWNKIKTFQNGKQNGVNGRRLRFWSGLLSRCTHEGGTGTRRRGYKLKYNI